MGYLTKKLKKDIQKGGIVIAPGRAGKTTAVIELLEQSDEYFLICLSMRHAENIWDELLNRGIKDRKEIMNCVGGPKTNLVDIKRKIIIDEFFWNPIVYSRNFLTYHCGITRNPSRLVVYDKKGKKLTLEKDEIYSSYKINVDFHAH
jgi:hypothetical protein